MGKFRPRVKGKGKRWQKGHSSSSNPESKKFRDAARSRFFQENLGSQSKLTSDALRKHDAFMGTKPEPIEVEEDESETITMSGKTCKTFQTFASDWSACSNGSFSKFLNRFTANSALHKEMLAVLAAITEVIKSNGGTETSTEYFAALMTTLGVSESEDSLGAVLTLLGMGIKSVPQSVLRKKFSEASKTFMDLLVRFAESENQVIVRSVIGCLSVLLRNQESVVWKNSSTVQVLDSILAFTTHSKPKIRKPAQHAICVILKSTSESTESHPAAPHVAKFCVRSLENSVGSIASQTALLHTLYLVKETIATFPKQNVKMVCETVLKVMTLNNVLVTSCGMQALHSLFVARPSAAVLPPVLNGQLISALYDYQPPVTDTQPTLAWLAVMQEAHINLGLQDLSMCCAHLPKLFTTVSQMWLSDKPDTFSNATHALAAVTTDCLRLAAAPEVVERYANTLSKVFGVLQDGLKYQYHNAWKHVIHLLGTFFENCGPTCESIVLPCLTALGELQDSYQFTFVNEVDHAIGRAIQSMGPKAVLKAIPLQITGHEVNNQIKRSWLLPILRESVQNAELAFFIEYFLPLASLSWKKCKELAAQGRKPESVIYELFQAQVWSLLPSFCNRPTDIKDSFKNIAKVLGTLITERKDLRLSVMSALRKLIQHCQAGEPDSKKEEDLKEIARFAKNYLPILFNLYTTKANGAEEEGHRLAAYETIKVYLSVADESLQHELFGRAFQKLKADEVDKFVREAVMDLLRVLLPYQSTENLAALFSLIQEGIADTKNNRYQKKSYRLLEVLCSSTSDICVTFQNEHLQDVQKLLLKSLSTSATSSRGARLRCLIHLVRRLPQKKANILVEIVPEAVLCVKDINERCRQAAFALLHELGLAMFRWQEEEDVSNVDIVAQEHKVMKDFLTVLLAGLAGSPQLTSATLLALADVTHHFKSKFPEDLLELVLQNVCILATSSTREITGAALSYLKQFVYSFPTTTVGPYVPVVMKAITSMTDDCKRHFRRETQHMLDRMIRKYGCDVIERQVPSSDEIMVKRIRNLRKLHARKQRLREERLKNKLAVEESDDEDFTVRARAKSIEEILAESDDELELEKNEAGPKGSKKKSQAWIKEEPGDIIDLADSMAASKISASKPSTSSGNGSIGDKNSKQDKNRGFKTASDGRLIIADDSSSDDEGEKKVKGSRRIPTISDSESDNGDEMNDGDAKSTKSGQTARGRKRKLSASTDARSTTTAGPHSKYQAGGSGIHRPVGKAMSVKSGVSAKSGKSSATTSFGAEYRSKKARGDVKKKDAPDPYAYVPLNRALLNKRKRLKQAGQFKGLVRAARKGAAAGRVAKTRISRK